MDIDKIYSMQIGEALDKLKDPLISLFFKTACTSILHLDKDAKLPTVKEIMEIGKSDEEFMKVMEPIIEELKAIVDTEEEPKVDYCLQEMVDAYKEHTKKGLEEE